MTNIRKTILAIIQTSDEHLTAEEIYRLAKQIQSSIAVGTVYRNLGLMREAGEIRRISLPNAPDRYDRILVPHEHLICQKCGDISDFSVPELGSFLINKTGIQLIGYDLNVKYICKRCKEDKP